MFGVDVGYIYISIYILAYRLGLLIRAIRRYMGII